MSRNSQSPKPRSGAGDPPHDRRARLDPFVRELITRIQRNHEDVDAIEQLAAHYADAEDHASLVNLLEGWGDTLQEPRAAADAYVRAAEAALRGKDDRERARLLYERALSRDATHADALESVLRLLEDDGNHERRKQVLKYAAFQLGQQPCDPIVHADVFHRLGEVYETHFGEPGKAAACYRSAIERNPKLVPAIVAARRLYAGVGNGKAVAALYEFEIEATPDVDDKRALLVALAEVKRRELTDLDGAIAVLRRALQSAPGDVEALRALGEVLVERSERGAPEDRTARGLDRKRAAEVFFQLGRALPALDAYAYLQRALSLCPEHEKAAKLLYELGTQGLLDDKTQLVDLADLQPDDSIEPTSSRADHSAPPAAEMARDSAEVWLNESEPRKDALSTGELLPLEVAASPSADRPSSLPPRGLLQGQNLSDVMPPADALRAPKSPTALLQPGPDPRESAEIPIQRVRRSLPPPPPPMASARASVPSPVEQLAPVTTPRPSAPPPAYAEIPGESGEHFTPVRRNGGREGTARRDPTLPSWRLPSDAEHLTPLRAIPHDPSAEALTPIVNELPPVKPQFDLPADDGAVARLTRLSVVSTQPDAPHAAAITETSPAPTRPSQRPPSRLAEAQNERFAGLAKSALSAKDAVELAAMPSAPSVPQPMAAGMGASITPDEPIHVSGGPSFDVEVGALSDTNFYVGFEGHVAAGGLFVATYTPLAIGAHAELRVALPGGYQTRALGQVWRISTQSDPFSDQVPGMWVRFTALSEEALGLFERFASHRAPLFCER